MSGKQQKQPEAYNVIYDVSQDIVATRFWCGETSDYDFITNLLLSLLCKSYWATVCKTVHPMLSDRCTSVCLSVCPVCLTVTLVYCGQTV